ncbi:Ankyrin repeat containing protein [Acanthamoeba castellanii str. Neff]|uniref:Ankyrin repeat containing protein n=1 Tax=Acanthamoeba castellanii (strain ATCC 30010 / Neff) TaxID=1257118 RepID=L8GIQ3_ACACF|nr:Ankyrin repeat containing protein [Acanthamoeba castellanii str. Neff]ELR12882.1 Ankyrin repeat containing protein [Acanthamoeba castellanii str. Neff]
MADKGRSSSTKKAPKTPGREAASPRDRDRDRDRERERDTKKGEEPSRSRSERDNRSLMAKDDTKKRGDDRRRESEKKERSSGDKPSSSSSSSGGRHGGGTIRDKSRKGGSGISSGSVLTPTGEGGPREGMDSVIAGLQAFMPVDHTTTNGEAGAGAAAAAGLEGEEEEEDDIQVLDAEGRSCGLHIAAAKDNVADVARYIKAGYDVNKPDAEGATALHHAAYRGSLQAAKVLMEAGAQVDATDTDLVTPLLHAAFMGQAEVVKLLVARGANINHKDKDGGMALQNACYNGHVGCVQILIDAGADMNHVDEDSSTCLHYAAFGGNLEVLKVLLKTKVKIEARDKDGQTAMHHAAYNGYLNICSALVDNGAKPSALDFGGATPLHLAAYNNKLSVVEYLLSLKVDLDKQDKEGATPLHKSAYMGDNDVLKLLIDKGANVRSVDNEGATPLHKAAFNGRAWCVKYLLEKGASVDAVDSEKGTPLHNAVYNGHTDCAAILIRHKAKIDAFDGVGRTALHGAACFGYRDCAALLLENAANPNCPDNEKFTPLHLAAFNGSTTTAVFLLDRGANPRAKNAEGTTPLHYAAYRGHTGIVSLLLERKAPVEVANDKGQTPLHNAALGGQVEAAAYLIYKGADVNVQDTERGDTPLHLAIRSDEVEMCALLVSKKADWDRLKNRDGDTAYKLAQEVKFPAILEFFSILSSDKNPMNPENRAKWMNLKRSDKKKELAELRTLWHVLKGQTMPLGGALPDPSPMGGRGGHEGQKGTNFENLGYAALGDLNDPVSICAQVKWEANRLKSSKNLLNLLRHLLLIPTHQKVGAKIWEVLEFFVHGVCILRDEHDVSKDLTRLSLEAFKKALNRKDKIVVDDKLALLHTIEEALKILFPQCETQGDDVVELIWEGIGDGDANDDDDSDGDDDDSEKEVDEDGATEYNSSDEETAKSAKKVKPRMRVNPKTGESEIQADMELDKDEENEEETKSKVVDFELPSIPDIEDDEPEAPAGATPSADAGGIPPPPPMFGGPPPPPGAGPPPPPGMGPPPLPGKAAFNGIKLKRFNWIKVPPGKLKKSMWVQAEKNTKGIVLENKTLESLFFLPTGKEKEEEAKNPKGQVSIINIQRANNVGILLCRFPISHSEIRKSILACDEKVLSLDMARSLVRLAPTKDEIEMIQQYKGDKDKLGAAEKFFLEMMVIPRLAERLACFVYKGEFATRYEELRIDIKECNVAMHELRTSNKLRRIMEVVLVLGNFMNRAYGYNGQGQGYTTDSLIKLVDTKSTIKVKGRSTYHLLHHLIQYLERVKVELLGWREEMPHIRDGHMERMNETIRQVTVIREGLAQVEEEIKHHKGSKATDPFGKVMSDFFEEAKEQLDKLNEDVTQMKKRYENLCAYFGEDPAKADPVSQIVKFGEAFKVAVAENALAQAAKEQAAKKALAASQMKKRISVGQRKSTKGKQIKPEGAALGKKAAKVSAKHLDKRREAGAKRVTDRMQRLKGKAIGRKNSIAKSDEAPATEEAA